MSSEMYIFVTRRGFLASELMRSMPEAEWPQIESAVERIAGEARTETPAELMLLLHANAQPFDELRFPDHGQVAKAQAAGR